MLTVYDDFAFRLEKTCQNIGLFLIFFSILY